MLLSLSSARDLNTSGNTVLLEHILSKRNSIENFHRLEGRTISNSSKIILFRPLGFFKLLRPLWWSQAGGGSFQVGNLRSVSKYTPVGPWNALGSYGMAYGPTVHSKARA